MNKWVFLYLSIRVFVDGSEEYIIQSTAWYYMEYLRKPKVFLGLTLAAFAAATCILAPLVAMIEVKFDAATVIVFVSGPVKLIGNIILYAIPVNGYFPLFGRLISGMGESTLGVLYGAVTKCTDKTNRAEAFLYFEGLYSVGAIFGPAIDSVLVFNINILGWKINPGNSPAVLLAIAWVFLITLSIFLPSDLAENSVAEEIELDTDSDESSGNENNRNYHRFSLDCLLFIFDYFFEYAFLRYDYIFYTTDSSVPPWADTRSREINLRQQFISCLNFIRRHLSLSAQDHGKKISLRCTLFSDYPNINHDLFRCRLEKLCCSKQCLPSPSFHVYYKCTVN